MVEKGNAPELGRGGAGKVCSQRQGRGGEIPGCGGSPRLPSKRTGRTGAPAAPQLSFPSPSPLAHPLPAASLGSPRGETREAPPSPVGLPSPSSLAARPGSRSSSDPVGGASLQKAIRPFPRLSRAEVSLRRLLSPPPHLLARLCNFRETGGPNFPLPPQKNPSHFWLI